MMFYRTATGVGAVTLLVLGLLAARVDGDAQHQGHGGMHAASPQSSSASEQRMRNADAMMARAESAMRDLGAAHTAAEGAHHHGQVIDSMQTTFDEMRRVQHAMREMMNDPDFGHSRDATRAFEQACRNLEQMARAFESMTKNMSKAMGGMSH